MAFMNSKKKKDSKSKKFRILPWRRKKHVHVQTHFFSDQVICDFSILQCPCDLYFPEPTVTFNESGAIQSVHLSEGNVTLQFNSSCFVHICEIPGIEPKFHFSIDDSGQDCKVQWCLNLVIFLIILAQNSFFYFIWFEKKKTVYLALFHKKMMYKYDALKLKFHDYHCYTRYTFCTVQLNFIIEWNKMD